MNDNGTGVFEQMVADVLAERIALTARRVSRARIDVQQPSQERQRNRERDAERKRILRAQRRALKTAG